MTSRRGVALVEAAAVVVVTLAVGALLLAAGGESRRLGRLGEDIGKLRRIGVLTGQYASDNTDLFWSFSWRGGVTYTTPWPDLNFANSDLQAGANQAVEILRRRAGRTDIPVITGWIPHVHYMPLTLADFTGSQLPEPLVVSAADRLRLLWSRDPEGFDAGLYPPGGMSSPPRKRTPYGASFIVPTAFYDRSPVGSRIQQSTVHNSFSVPPGAALKGALVSSVQFPASKVMMHDQFARHFGPVAYATHDHARLPLLFVDGSVAVRGAAESNVGWRPNFPQYSIATNFFYQPDAWEPPPVSGGSSDLVTGRFQWTRGIVGEHGIAGRDFDGPETCSGQPGCP